MLGIGLVYKRLGLLEEALFWLEKCVSVEDAPQAAMIALGQACMETSKPSEGIEVLERTLEVLGETAPLLMSLGQLHLKVGNAEVGNKILRRALEAA